MKNFKQFFISVLLLGALAACGGGGGDSSPVAVPAPNPASAPPPAPALTNSDLVTSVATPTYVPGTVENGAWNLLMQQRRSCGFGLVQQDSRLDAAASAHAHYLAQNSIDQMATVIGHGEDATWNYFTGGNPLDRAVHAGLPATGISEILTNTTLFYPLAQAAPLVLNEAAGAAQMRSLIETVYHAQGAFNAGRAGGVGTSSKNGPTSSTAYSQQQFRLVADFSIDDNPQRLGSSNLATWPCDGLAGVGGTFTPATELPNPFPEVIDAAVKFGTPIYFKADAGNTLVVSSATVTKVSDGSGLAFRQLTNVNDAAGEIGTHEVFLVPTTPLAAGNRYTVNATGTLNGVVFTRDFTFSTAP